MERDIPSIRVGKFYFFLALITFILLTSTGHEWNYFLALTGIYIPPAIIISIGILISLVFGFLDKVEGKTNVFLLIIYPLGFIIAFATIYMLYNWLNFSSVSGAEVYAVLIVPLLPGFGLIKLFQHFYNNHLEDKYWKEREQNKAKKNETEN